jgi:hypothetical protein
VGFGSRFPCQTRANHRIVDYNSWIESKKALKLASRLDKDVIIVEGAFPPTPSCQPR